MIYEDKERFSPRCKLQRCSLHEHSVETDYCEPGTSDTCMEYPWGTWTVAFAFWNVRKERPRTLETEMDNCGQKWTIVDRIGRL